MGIFDKIFNRTEQPGLKNPPTEKEVINNFKNEFKKEPTPKTEADKEFEGLKSKSSEQLKEKLGQQIEGQR